MCWCSEIIVNEQNAQVLLGGHCHIYHRNAGLSKFILRYSINFCEKKKDNLDSNDIPILCKYVIIIIIVYV